MKKIIYGGICFASGILITLMVVNYNSVDETIYDNTNALKTSSRSIAMMLETDLDSDEYFLSTDTSWPDSSSYSFNSTLSKCENGSTLSWDGKNNQVLMTGNTSDKCYIYFDYTPVFSQYIISLYTTDGENSLYYHDGVGTYTNADLEAGDYSYRYSGGDYLLTDTATSAGYTSLYAASATANSSALINFYCNGELSFVGYNCSLSYEYYYTLAYDPNATQYTTYDDVINKAISDGYLEMDYVDNFVCFGSESETCNEDSLYRIIGIFQNESGKYEVKLIKYSNVTSSLLGKDGDYQGQTTTSFYSGSRVAEYATNHSRYYWNNKNYDSSFSDTGYYNDWSYSQLNTVNLNTNYLNNLDSTWQDMITTHTWIVGGNTHDNMSLGTAYSVYQAELINYSDQVTTTYEDEIGLIYVSDYCYSADPSYWTYAGYNGDYSQSYAAAKDKIWMYMGISDWTITRSSSTSTLAFAIGSPGRVAGGNDYVDSNGGAVRPTFYLSSSVLVIEGDGSYDSPYRLKLAS